MKDHQDRIGQQIGGYRLLRPLGRGSFGAVYLAQSTTRQEPVALKLLQMPLSSTEEFKSFLNEARAIRLQHPHIVPLLDFGTNREDLPYLVMEYVPGGTLRERYTRGTRLHLAVVCHYISQMASALHYAHEHQVIHRDVKPENMLLRTDGMALLSDFGIAWAVEQSMSASPENMAGTPGYIAPEQSYGQPHPASDQYALAVVAYEWLVGCRPFAGTAMEIVIQHRLDPPPSLRAIRPDLPAGVEQVIAHALGKRPEERFATIEQFAQALNAASQQASQVNIPFMPAASSPSLSAPIAPSLTLPHKMASQIGAPSMSAVGPAETPVAHTLASYVMPSNESLPLPKESMTSPNAVRSTPIQPREHAWSAPQWRRIVLAALALLVIAGSLFTYFGVVVPNNQLQAAHQATVSASIHQATVKAMATARIEQTT